MIEPNLDAKQEESQTTTEPSPVKKEQATNVSEDANTQKAGTGKTFQEKYEDSIKAIRAEREAKLDAKSRADELEAKLAKMETQEPQQETEYSSVEAKVDMLTLMNKDSFFRENSDLVEQKMVDNPAMDARTALNSVKADILDKAMNDPSTVEVNKPLTQQRPTAAAEPTQQVAKDVTLKGVMAGKTEIDPMQLEAIRNVMPRQR